MTTPMVSAPTARAISATTGAAPVPVPPPLPAVMNTMSAPFSASSISPRCSSAAWRPTSGSLPAPSPRVSWRPMSSFRSASLMSSAWRVGVGGDELDALEPGLDHAVHGVHPTAADAHDLDDSEVAALRWTGHRLSSPRPEPRASRWVPPPGGRAGDRLRAPVTSPSTTAFRCVPGPAEVPSPYGRHREPVKQRLRPRGGAKPWSGRARGRRCGPGAAAGGGGATVGRARRDVGVDHGRPRHAGASGTVTSMSSGAVGGTPAARSAARRTWPAARRPGPSRHRVPAERQR